MPRDNIEYSQPVGDQVAYTTCYMCACRCGIKVHLRDGTLRYIEGNRDHPVNRGVLCAKGSAGIMNVLSPARLRAPLKRIGPRGSGERAPRAACRSASQVPELPGPSLCIPASALGAGRSWERAPSALYCSEVRSGEKDAPRGGA